MLVAKSPLPNCPAHSAAAVFPHNQPTQALNRHKAPGVRRHCRQLIVAAAMAAPAGDGTSQRVVICGGGIIGAATAYYLATQHGVAATVVEREELAAAASGKAGGFLALDWNDSSPVGQVARRSYALHAELAQRFGREVIGYREVDTVQVVGSASAPAGTRGGSSRSGQQQLPDWLDGHITRSSMLGTKSTTAQVHPAKLTRALMSAAQEAAGAQLVIGTVTGINTSGGAVTGVRVVQQQQQLGQPDNNNDSSGSSSGGGEQQEQEVELPADAVVLAMGPWSDAARAWLPTAPEVTGQKYHSVVLRPQQPVSDTCVFTAFRTADGRSIEPELYPRPDGTVYVCGEPSSVPVPPEGPAAVSLDHKALQVLQGVASSLASGLSSAAVEVEQACYLPLSSDGLPLIGRLPGASGVYVASGHSCWGILNGPATGEAMAQLIIKGESSLDLGAFDPARFVSRAAAARRR